MQKRLDIILDLIRENGFVTVKYLCEKLHYSTATINRDLNELQNQKIIVRKYGGAEMISKSHIPVIYRSEKNKKIKMQIAKHASYYIADYNSMFINGSTTTHYIGKYITDLKNIKVITNNINLASTLSDNNITAICLGGKIVDSPFITGGPEPAMQAESYHVDLVFLSTYTSGSNGTIYTGDGQFTLYRTMLKNADKRIYLIDSSKIDLKGNRVLCDFSKIDVVISDYKFSDEVKKKFPNTEFIEVENTEEE